MDTQSELEETKINAFITDMNDTKQAIVNLLDTLKKMNLALSIISDNQNHLNGKLNQIYKEFRDANDKHDKDNSVVTNDQQVQPNIEQ